MGLGDWIAGYAAVVATAVMLWDIYKWRREKRVHLVGTATSGMVAYGSAETSLTKGKTYVAVRVANRGELTCMVTHLALLSYSSVFHRWRGKNNKAAVVIDPMGALTQCRFPYKLEPGGEYTGMIEQTPELEDWSRRESLYTGLYHSMSKRPYLMRLEPIESKIEKK